jgi:hypothetical protein
MTVPFKCFRVTAGGDYHAHFEVAVMPAHWLRGEESVVEEQRRFIREAIRGETGEVREGAGRKFGQLNKKKASERSWTRKWQRKLKND